MPRIADPTGVPAGMNYFYRPEEGETEVATLRAKILSQQSELIDFINNINKKDGNFSSIKEKITNQFQTLHEELNKQLEQAENSMNVSKQNFNTRREDAQSARLDVGKSTVNPYLIGESHFIPVEEHNVSGFDYNKNRTPRSYQNYNNQYQNNQYQNNYGYNEYDQYQQDYANYPRNYRQQNYQSPNINTMELGDKIEQLSGFKRDKRSTTKAMPNIREETEFINNYGDSSNNHYEQEHYDTRKVSNKVNSREERNFTLDEIEMKREASLKVQSNEKKPVDGYEYEAQIGDEYQKTDEMEGMNENDEDQDISMELREVEMDGDEERLDNFKEVVGRRTDSNKELN